VRQVGQAILRPAGFISTGESLFCDLSINFIIALIKYLYCRDERLRW
jgi:hypothetical protein